MFEVRPLIGVAFVGALMLADISNWVRADEPPVTVKPADPPGSPPRTSEFLRPPGLSDRYDPNIDWSTIPPWQQTSFFGIRARGRRFVYVVDCSGSMDDGSRLLRAKNELRRSVMSLRNTQGFLIIFYNDRPLAMPGGILTTADASTKSQMLRWLSLIEAGGETDPRGAMTQALSLRPDAVYLLSDGEFPNGTVEAIGKRNPRKIPIHCIDLAGGTEGNHLQRIARESGGQYTSQP
jgi:hypothetical protein